MLSETSEGELHDGVCTKENSNIGRESSATELDKLGNVTLDQRKLDDHHDHDQLREVEEQISSTAEVEEELWTVYSAKVCLPSVLSDPSRWRPEADFFTKSWGETFLPLRRLPSHHLPIIKKSEFAYYVKQLAKPYRSHKRSTRLPASAVAGEGPISRVQTTVPGSALRKNYQRLDVTGIPKIFLQPDFDLGNLATFREALPLQLQNSDHDGLPNSSSRWTTISCNDDPVQTSRLLHEKLTHFLDRVEIQLARQIALKSEDFFRTISSQDTLTDDIILLRRDVTSLREKFLSVSNPVNEGPLQILLLKKRQLRLIAVYHKLKLMETVHQTQPTIQLLLATSDFVGALDLISTTQEVLQQELVGVQSFRHLGSQLIEMERMIEKVMEAEFVQFTTAGLAQLRPEKVQFEPDDEDKLTSIVFGLLRLRKVRFLDTFRDEAFTAIKACIKQTVRRLVGIQSERDEISGISVAEHMRRLSFDEWFGMLQTVFESVLIILRRLQVVHKLIVCVLELCRGQLLGKETQEDVDDEITGHPIVVRECGNARIGEEESMQVTVDMPVETVSVEELDGQAVSEDLPTHVTRSGNMTSGILTSTENFDVEAESSELLRSACELVHVRCAKLISVKAKDGSLECLIAPDFVRLVRALEKFIGDCESVCGRQSHSLRATILAQAKKYLEKFHEEKRAKLVLLLDGEQWTQVDEVPVQLQGIVAAMENGEVCLPEPPRRTSLPSEKLVLSGQGFIVPGAMLLLLRIVYEYCRTADDMPMLMTDVMSRLIEVFQMFNKRTWQLVLGAGALQTVGLKSITAKHLALSSQCMCAVAALIPSVREYFQRRLQIRERVLLAQFNTLSEDYKNHVVEIQSKLLSMIEDVILKQLYKWDGKTTAPSPGFRNIVKQIAKLHDVLKSLLSPGQLLNLFLSVQRVFHTALKQRLLKLGVVEPSGDLAQALELDLKFFVENLKQLNGLEDIEKYLDDVWTSK